VAGVADVDWGQRLVALVATRAPIDEEALRAFLRQRLAPFKVPKEIVFVAPDQLPIGPSGKPLRRKVSELIATSVRRI
jgi:fatty-acyl-CoA synthase